MLHEQSRQPARISDVALFSRPPAPFSSLSAGRPSDGVIGRHSNGRRRISLIGRNPRPRGEEHAPRAAVKRTIRLPPSLRRRCLLATAWLSRSGCVWRGNDRRDVGSDGISAQPRREITFSF